MSAARGAGEFGTVARRVAPLALALSIGGCASQGAPPGGPPDAQAPKLVRIIPDTGAVNVRPPAVVFQFDEVVSERPQGAQSLDGMFLISPRDGAPDVAWHRDNITVRPQRGFHANTVYTITMLPGIADLRSNVRKEGATAVFSTGPTMPATTVRGIVFDWVKGEVVPRAFVEAIVPDTTPVDTSARRTKEERRRARRDSVVYVTTSDSSGRFAFSHLPAGPYVVRGFVDANNNRALDPREAWDTIRVSLADSARVELLAFVHDTAGPRIASVEQTDSVTLRVAFDNPLSPAIRPESATFVLRAADSSVVPIAFVRAARDSSMAMLLPYTPPGAAARPGQPQRAPGAVVAPAAPPVRTPPPKPTPKPPPARRPAARRPTAAEMRAVADSAARADSIARAAAIADSIARRDSVRRDSVARDSLARARGGAQPAIPPAALPARRDTARRRDTVPAVPRLRPSKVPPVTEVVITLRKPLVPGTTYRLEVRGARGMLGAERASDRTFTAPKTPPAVPPSDSAARAGGKTPPAGRRPEPATPVRPDSTRRDSTRAVPPRRPPTR